jgi:arginine N-succinyltransferase
LISYVRFLFIATHRDRFEEELLAELLPPLEADGTSHLWEAFGRRFTGMSYLEADLLSSRDKTFIRDLFPVTVHASLFSEEARAVIGRVGKQTRGVEKMLRRVGFRYAERIDPFDGGPHFVARANDVTLIRQASTHALQGPLAHATLDSQALVSVSLPEAPYFRAVLAEHSAIEKEGARLPEATIEHLELASGDRVSLLPLAARRRKSQAPQSSPH